MSEMNRFPHAIAFRVDTATHQQLVTVAEAAGVAPGPWVRALVIKALGSAMRAPRVQRAAANSEMLSEVLTELKAHGRNLNQLSRLSNGSGSLVSVTADIEVMRASTEHVMARVLGLLNIEGDA